MWANTIETRAAGYLKLTRHRFFDFGALYSFVALTARVFPRLPEPAQNLLKSRISGALKDNVGLSPLAFEMRTVAHLMARGFDVEFHDLCEGGGYDFLAKARDI